jgi:hypothetical protein
MLQPASQVPSKSFTGSSVALIDVSGADHGCSEAPSHGLLAGAAEAGHHWEVPVGVPEPGY